MLNCYSITQNADFLAGKQLPDFVKLANLQPPRRSKSLPDSSYALILMGKEAGSLPEPMYPIYDRASTWTTGQYVAENLDGMPKTAAVIAARNIYGAATLFGVDIPHILKKVAAMTDVTIKSGSHYFYNPSEPVFRREVIEKVASGESITIDGTVRPIRNCMELNRAEEWFGEKHLKMAQADKYALAQFIVRRREELAPAGEKTAFTIHVSDEATKIASLNAFNPRFKFAMIDRVNRCTDRESCADYMALYREEKIAAVSGPMAMIDQIERIDKVSGLREHYGFSIPSAIDTVLIHTKTAEEIEVEHEKTATVKLGGSMGIGGVDVPLADVRRAIKTGRLSKMFSPEMVEKLAKDPEAGLSALYPEFGDMLLADTRRF